MGRHLRLAAIAVFLATTVASLAHGQAAAWSPGELDSRRVLAGLSSPVGIANAGDGSGRLFIVERRGTVRVVKDNAIQPGFFLDLQSVVEDGGERGLLGLAFDPDFTTNRRLFVFYTRNDGDLVVARLTTNQARTDVDEASREPILLIEHSEHANHNGGALAFGPRDGYLYVAVGDGGGAGDPLEAGQDRNRLLGKILRLDVDGSGAGPFGRYAIPPDNPFVGASGLDEIWAYGLRNPWRITFDRATEQVWIGDVGQGRYEEIDREPAGWDGGANYGWSIMEGDHCYSPTTGCPTGGLTRPLTEYAHGSSHCSVTGGYVYRGPSQRRLQGDYVFADYCSGSMWRMDAATTTGAKTLQHDVGSQVTSFGEAENGELYLVTLGGALYRVLAPEFSDITASTFIDDIHWLLYEGLTAGCSATTYCPTANVTREQMAIFLDRALDLPPTATDFFTDDEGRTGEAAINRLRAAGITVGCTATTFCPTANVTREQMAIFLDRALDLPPTGSDFFTDDSGRSGEAAINRLRAAGITSGCTPTTYCPTANVTREQMAAFLRRAFED